MDNNELKIKSIEVQQKIDKCRTNGENPAPYLKEKIELLEIGYKKLSEQLQDDKFEKNPKKYSTLLSYQNNIKNLQQELQLPTQNTDNEIAKIEAQMQKAGLGWLLNTK